MTNPIFAVVYENGRAETQKEGSTYWSILDAVYREYQSAGGNWNRPNMLLLNGKVVIDRGLSDLAWKYGKDAYDARCKADDATKAAHKPGWLT